MNRFAACGDLKAEGGPRIAKMTKDEMVKWFKSAPEDSRHQRMLWTARKIAHLTGVTEGRAYQMLLGPLIKAEREPPDEYLDVLGLTQRQTRRSQRRFGCPKNSTHCHRRSGG